ncbi:receptor-like protein kinase ANXUR2 [Cynara cardunculus var. scolymus]|nr:receptor-like protein kinase ANXUR2 [Cynara cardunculus var. scolymus]
MALDYLHTGVGTRHGVIHHDVKSSNILLDENWAAKISDFGELRLAVDICYGDEKCSLVRWAQKCVKDRKLNQMVDSNIRGTIFPKCLRRFAQIANRCLHSVPKERPSMTEVVASLQVLLVVQKKHDDSEYQAK